MTTGELDPRQNDPLCHPVRQNADGSWHYKCQDDGYEFDGPAREEPPAPEPPPPPPPKTPA